jgi:hypothetical protein
VEHWKITFSPTEFAHVCNKHHLTFPEARIVWVVEMMTWLSLHTGFNSVPLRDYACVDDGKTQVEILGRTRLYGRDRGGNETRS